jgi:hypothetical protein
VEARSAHQMVATVMQVVGELTLVHVEEVVV